MTAGLGVLCLAAGLLAYFALTGWGLLRLLAPGLQVDVAAALAPAVGLAAFSALAAFVVLRLPIWLALLTAACLPLVAVGIAGARSRGRPRREPPPALVPLAAVAVAAILAASVPSFVHGGGMPATWGNADPYIWVSQAKSLLDGPPPAPATRFPDRDPYEQLSGGGFAPGLPALTAVAAVVAREDPVDVYDAVAALLYALTPLVAFAVARGALSWSSRLSVAAAAVVTLSPYRLFGSYYGWQPQFAGVACLLAAMLLFRLRLAGGGRGLTALAALLLAGALGIYRLPFLPYLVFATVLVVAGYVLARRRQHSAVSVAARQTGMLVGAIVLLAAPSAAAFFGHGWGFWEGRSERSGWAGYVRGLPSDALGLAPRSPDLAHQPPLAFTLVALVLSLVVLAGGVHALRRRTAGHPDLVLTLCVGSLAALLVAQLPLFTPYLSIKLDAYGTVPMILTALAPLQGRSLPQRRLVLGGLLAVLSLASVFSAGRVTLSAKSLSPLAARASAVPASQAIRIGFRSSWKQMWAIYFMRDHAVSIAHPSGYLPPYGRRRPARRTREAARGRLLKGMGEGGTG